MRRFMMLRRIDETGVSGTGHIADGVVFDDGTVVVRWRTQTPGTTVFASLGHAKTVHGHDGKTVFEFHDDEPPLVWLCCLCFSDMDPPVNHCLQCGAGGTAVPMSRSQLDMIQRHDQDRLTQLKKCHTELEALRRVAIDTYGPTSLGLRVSRFTGVSGEEHVSIARGDTSYGVRPLDGESDEAFMKRAGERCALDPDHVRRIHAERAGALPPNGNGERVK